MGCGSSKVVAVPRSDRIVRSTYLHPDQRRIVENFIVVWLDGQIAKELSAENADIQRSMNSLRSIVNELHMFSAIESCAIFLNGIQHEKVFFLVSGSLGEQCVPRFHSLSQIAYIYIFCSNRILHEKWTKKYSKIKGIFTTIDTICNTLKLDAKTSERDLIEFEVLSRVGGQDKNKLDITFIYSQLIKEILLDTDDETDSQFDKTDMISFCRIQYANNPTELSFIDAVEHNHDPSKTPIWFYTSESFLYKMLNKALRTCDLDTLYYLRFFLRQVHKQLVGLFYSEMFSILKKISEGKTSTKILHRGQGMSQNDFEKLKANQGSLLTFNNFLSTSSSEKMGMSFAQQARDADHSGTVSLLMHIEIDLEAFVPKSLVQALPQLFADHQRLNFTTDADIEEHLDKNLHLSLDTIKEALYDPSANIKNCPFAEISHLSAFPTESEVLFSSSTIFRIHKLQRGAHGIWHLYLSMTNDSDTKLRSSLKYYRSKCTGRHPLHRLAKLLFQMERIDESEQFYLRLLNDSSPLTSVVARDNLTRAQCHIELGNILRIKKQYQQATEHTNKASEIIYVMKSEERNEKILLELIILVASLLLLNANMARDRGNMDQAKIGTFEVMEVLLAFHEQYGGQDSFEMIMACLSDLLQLCIQCNDDDSLFARTQTIWSQLPPEFHTDNAAVAMTYHQFAICLEKRNLIREALEQAEKALTIARNVLPSDDSKLNEYKQHVDKIRRKL